MLPQFALTPITAKTKGEIKRLRKSGFVPVSLQHKGMTTVHYQQASEPLDAFIKKYGDAALLDLVIAPDDQKQRAIIQNVHRDAITQKLLQVTFQQIRFDDTLKTHVSLRFSGEPNEVHLGNAMLQHSLDMLDIECAQDSLPEYITVDVSNMSIGDVIRVSDLVVDSHYKILNSGNTVLASVTINRTATDVPASPVAPPVVAE